MRPFVLCVTLCFKTSGLIKEWHLSSRSHIKSLDATRYSKRSSKQPQRGPLANLFSSYASHSLMGRIAVPTLREDVADHPCCLICIVRLIQCKFFVGPCDCDPSREIRLVPDNFLQVCTNLVYSLTFSQNTMARYAGRLSCCSPRRPFLPPFETII